MSAIAPYVVAQGQSVASASSSLFIKLLSFLEHALEELYKYVRWFLQQLWRDPDRTITYMLVLGALLG